MEGHTNIADCQTPRFRRSPPKHTRPRPTHPHVTQKVAGAHPSQRQLHQLPDPYSTLPSTATHAQARYARPMWTVHRRQGTHSRRVYELRLHHQ
jgi:hypothetical protein